MPFCQLVAEYHPEVEMKNAAPCPSSSSTAALKNPPKKRWGSAHIHLLCLAISDLTVDFACVGGAAWYSQMTVVNGSIVVADVGELPVSAGKIGNNEETVSNVTTHVISTTPSSTPFTIPTTPIQMSGFMRRYLVWYFVTESAITINRWFTVFITFLRAKSLRSLTAASEALKKTPRIVGAEVAAFIIVAVVFHVVFSIILVYAYCQTSRGERG